MFSLNFVAYTLLLHIHIIRLQSLPFNNVIDARWALMLPVS